MEKIGHLFELSLDKTQILLKRADKNPNSTGVPCHFSENFGKMTEKRIKFGDHFWKFWDFWEI